MYGTLLVFRYDRKFLGWRDAVISLPRQCYTSLVEKMSCNGLMKSLVLGTWPHPMTVRFQRLLSKDFPLSVHSSNTIQGLLRLLIGRVTSLVEQFCLVWEAEERLKPHSNTVETPFRIGPLILCCGSMRVLR